MIKMKEINLSFEDFNESMEELGGSKIIKISEPEDNIIRVYYDSTWLEQRELSKNYEKIEVSEMVSPIDYLKFLITVVTPLMLVFYIISFVIAAIL